MILLSPLAKGGGYQSTNYYTHSATVRTIQNIFNLRPYLGGAASSPDLGELFQLGQPDPGTKFPSGPFTFTFTGLTPDRTYYLQATTNLASGSWLVLSTNVTTNSQFTFSDPESTNFSQRFYRLNTTP
jgi:hypothetical protein